MGSYESEYESYYNSLKKNGRAVYSPSYNNYSKNSGLVSLGINKKGYLIKRIIRDLVGVLLLFIFIISCKIVSMPKTQAVYNYSKNIVNKTYDYKQVEENIRSIDLKQIQYKIMNTIEQFRKRIISNEARNSVEKDKIVLLIEGMKYL
ncbi:endopeptidase [Clostridium sp. DJ247]|uniref:endopeptidase n=1 Tax=Clostridium sp. DJ247 TaxID=2726188 RepID=UPI0016250D0F|nr:endopeptidase [Clostridium sp. DJ247]